VIFLFCQDKPRDYAVEEEYVTEFGPFGPNPKLAISRSPGTTVAVHQECKAGFEAFGYLKNRVSATRILRTQGMFDFAQRHPVLGQLQSLMDTKEGVKYNEVLKLVGAPEHRTLVLLSTSPMHGVLGDLAARISSGRVLCTGSSSADFFFACVPFFDQCSEFCLCSWFTSPSLFKTPWHCPPESILRTTGVVQFSMQNDCTYWMDDSMRGTRRQAPPDLSAQGKLLFHLDGQRTLMHAPFSGWYTTQSHFFWDALAVVLPPFFFVAFQSLSRTHTLFCL